MDTWLFTASSGIDEDKILEYINKRTDQKVIIKKSLIQVLLKSFIPILAFVAVIVGLIKLRFIIMNPISWFVLSCGVFLICCGGVMHNILHHVPLSGAHRNDQGEIEYEYISTGVIPHVIFRIATRTICRRRLHGVFSKYLLKIFSPQIVLLIGGSFIGIFFIFGLNTYKA